MAIEYLFLVPAIFVLLVFIWKELSMGICTTKTRLDGKLALVTGGNTGIGFETAKGLAVRGARIVIGCRNKVKGMEAVTNLIKCTGNKDVSMMEIDMSDLKSVRRFAEEFNNKEEKLDLLVNNAGIASNRDAQGKRTLTLTGDKIELILQTNHYGPFLLTNLLKEALAGAGNARIVNVASMMNIYGNIDFSDIRGENSYDMSYSNSKLMNILFSNELARRWKDLGISSFSLHPGLVRTEIFDKTAGLLESTMKKECLASVTPSIRRPGILKLQLNCGRSPGTLLTVNERKGCCNIWLYGASLELLSHMEMLKSLQKYFLNTKYGANNGI